jgi:hypothetical protein
MFASEIGFLFKKCEIRERNSLYCPHRVLKARSALGGRGESLRILSGLFAGSFSAIDAESGVKTIRDFLFVAKLADLPDFAPDD